MIKKITIILTIILVFVVTITMKNNTYASPDTLTNKSTTIVAEELIKDSKEEEDMKKNTTYLQNIIDQVSGAGGGIVRIPEGTYHFVPGGKNNRNVEYYIIKCKDNVTIQGAGTNSNTGTILKPVGNLELPIDMFYYNEYADSYATNNTYLVNADFKDFIIDSELTATTGNYNSAGKGFMINLYKDCDWENVIVKNTDGTGFGMDNPINSTITNCIAIGCGKAGSSSVVGGSGFGIGSGYSEKESIIIDNCQSYGNMKYGFFFEHQGRFEKNYTARKAIGFVVKNSVASGNMYNFGGERANDVLYQNCKTYGTTEHNPMNIKNISAIHFGTNSRRTKLENCEVNQKFADVTDPSKYYYQAIYWALNKSIAEGSAIDAKFNPDNKVTKAETIVFLWRMAERPGEVLLKNETLGLTLNDVTDNSWYADAVKWALEKNIIRTNNNRINPEKECTKAEFITYLWRYAGEPIVSTNTSYTDIEVGNYYEEAVKWAVDKGIIENIEGKFEPNNAYTRADVITLMYRYYNKININNSTNNDSETDSGIDNDKPDTNISDNKQDINISDNKQNSNNSNNEDNNNTTKEEPKNNNIKQENNSLTKIEDNNTELKELYLSKGIIKFDKEIKSYNIVVSYNIEELEIIGTPCSEKAKVEGLGKKTLNIGQNKFIITVIAENGEQSNYEITILRKEEDKNEITLDNNNDLKDLIVEGYNIDFNSTKLNYELKLNNSSKLNIEAIPSSNKSEIIIIGNENLEIGSKVKIIVVAENQETKIYTLHIVDNNNKIYFVIGISTIIICSLFVMKKIKNNKNKNLEN